MRYIVKMVKEKLKRNKATQITYYDDLEVLREKKRDGIY